MSYERYRGRLAGAHSRKLPKFPEKTDVKISKHRRLGLNKKGREFIYLSLNACLNFVS